jgi:hypothetical protein
MSASSTAPATTILLIHGMEWNRTKNQAKPSQANHKRGTKPNEMPRSTTLFSFTKPTNPEIKTKTPIVHQLQLRNNSSAFSIFFDIDG